MGFLTPIFEGPAGTRPWVGHGRTPHPPGFKRSLLRGEQAHEIQPISRTHLLRLTTILGTHGYPPHSPGHRLADHGAPAAFRSRGCRTRSRGPFKGTPGEGGAQQSRVAPWNSWGKNIIFRMKMLIYLLKKEFPLKFRNILYILYI